MRDDDAFFKEKGMLESVDLVMSVSTWEPYIFTRCSIPLKSGPIRNTTFH